MKTTLFMILLLSTNVYSYPVDRQDYYNMDSEERLCVKSVKEQKGDDVDSIISSRFNRSLSNEIFDIVCEEPASGLKFDLLRSSLMNPFYLEFEKSDDMGYSDGVYLGIFQTIFLSVNSYRKIQCAIIVKDKDGNNLIEFATNLKSKVEKKKQDEIKQNGHSLFAQHLENIIDEYNNEIRSMKTTIGNLSIDPETDCPSWK